MLGEGLRAGLRYLGAETRTVCYIEREAYAAALLATRIQDGALDDAPIWADLLTFDATAWRGAVDCVVAGFPCQDLSLAGQRAGLDGKRSGLFFDILKIAHDCDAKWAILENVAGIASATATVVDAAGQTLSERAAARIVGELADSGWDAEWFTLSAASVGASHKRERWFCVARRRALGDTDGRYASGPDDKLRRAGTFGCASQQLADTNVERSQRSGALAGETRRNEFAQPRADVANARREQRQTRHEQDQSGCAACGSDKTHDGPAHRGHQLADSDSPRLQRRRDSAQGRQATPGHAGLGDRSIFAPGPKNPAWPGIIAASPWLAPATQPGVCGVAHGLAFAVDEHRTQRLRACGNGVVALQAAAAIVQLFRRMRNG
jgi:DNA (cytosine-5)-methyltransferase 1